MRRVHVHIERLVLREFGSLDGRAFGDGLRAGLEEQLADPRNADRFLALAGSDHRIQPALRVRSGRPGTAAKNLARRLVQGTKS